MYKAKIECLEECRVHSETPLVGGVNYWIFSGTKFIIRIKTIFYQNS